jgi:hypothetical protein
MPEVRTPRAVDDVLADLARHPGWAILEERAKAEHQRQAEDLARTIIHLPAALDPLKLERARGFWAGQRWLLRQAKHELTAYRKQQPTT